MADAKAATGPDTRVHANPRANRRPSHRWLPALGVAMLVVRWALRPPLRLKRSEAAALVLARRSRPPSPPGAGGPGRRGAVRRRHQQPCELEAGLRAPRGRRRADRRRPRLGGAHGAGRTEISHNPNLGGQVCGTWTKLGENVGIGVDVDALMQAFVDSPAHYRNLVDPDCDYVGVGVTWAQTAGCTPTHGFMAMAASAPPPPPAPAPQRAPTPATTAAARHGTVPAPPTHRQSRRPPPPPAPAHPAAGRRPCCDPLRSLERRVTTGAHFQPDWCPCERCHRDAGPDPSLPHRDRPRRPRPSTCQPGEVLALLGPNGAGKTTTVRLLNGVLRPDRGRATVLGLDPAVDGDEVRRRTGVLTENAGLDDRLTRGENLELTARMRGMSTAAARAAVDGAARALRHGRPGRRHRAGLLHRAAQAPRAGPGARCTTPRCSSSTSRRRGSTRPPPATSST